MTAPSAVGSFIVRPRSRPAAGLRLLCFPYAGGGVAAFRGWWDAIDEDVEVCCVRTPGRETRYRQPPMTDVNQLAAAIAAELAHWTDRPYAIYGHSVGALVAFEVVRELRRARLPLPVHFFAGASRAPHLPPPQPLLHALPDGEFLEQVHRRYDSVPRQIFDDPDIRDLVLPALRADVTAFETYNYVASPPMDCPVTAFGGAGDSLVGHAALDAWRVHTAGEFELEMMPGGHIFVLTALSRLLASIGRCLRAAAGPGISKGAGKLC